MKSKITIKDLLLSFDPSEAALLDWLRSRIDDSHLREIAAADGGYKAEEHFYALKRIYMNEPITEPLTFVPCEVLQLAQYPFPTSQGISSHLISAFCCAVLLRVANDGEILCDLSSENKTLILLVDNVLELGKEACQSTLRFLSWRILRLSNEFTEAPFFAMAMLILRVALFETGQDGSDISTLCEWVIEEEARVRTLEDNLFPSDQWLLGLTFHDSCHEIWRMVTQRVLLNPTKLFPEPAASSIHKIANQLHSLGTIEITTSSGPCSD